MPAPASNAMDCVGLYAAPGGRVEVRYAGEYLGRFKTEALAKEALAKKRGVDVRALPKRSDAKKKVKKETDTGSSKTTSKFVCVTSPREGRWVANMNGKYLGVFSSELSAAMALKAERGYVTKRRKAELTDGEHGAKRFKVLHDALIDWLPADYHKHMEIRRRGVVTI